VPLVPPRIVLASASPRRRELLGHLGVTFDVQPADLDETTEERDPALAAEELARRKARAVAAEHPDAVVIGSDTIVVLSGAMLAKPEDAEEARAMLRALCGRAHEVLTGIAVLHGDASASAVERTRVVMREYSDAEIEDWIGTGEPFDKAGGYAIQAPVFRPVDRIDGCECGVIGLPLWALRTALAQVGVETPPPDVERCGACPARPRND
jgi:septum formation protein